MASIKLKFKMPEEEEDARMALNGASYSSALCEIRDYLRQALREKRALLSDHKQSDAGKAAALIELEALRDFINDEMESRNLPLD